jgi:hypothetical protein
VGRLGTFGGSAVTRHERTVCAEAAEVLTLVSTIDCAHLKASRDGTTCAVWLVFIAVLGPIVGEGGGSLLPTRPGGEAEDRGGRARPKVRFSPGFFCEITS